MEGSSDAAAFLIRFSPGHWLGMAAEAEAEALVANDMVVKPL